MFGLSLTAFFRSGGNEKREREGKRQSHADVYLCFKGKIRIDGKAQADAPARAGRDCEGDARQHLLERFAHQARKRSPRGSGRDGRPRDGGRRRGGGARGHPCQAGGSRDGQRGDVLRRMLFLQKGLCQQLHGSKRRLGARLPHRRRAGGICAGALCGSGAEQNSGRRDGSAGAAGGRCAGYRVLGGAHLRRGRRGCARCFA